MPEVHVAPHRQPPGAERAEAHRAGRRRSAPRCPGRALISAPAAPLAGEIRALPSSSTASHSPTPSTSRRTRARRPCGSKCSRRSGPRARAGTAGPAVRVLRPSRHRRGRHFTTPAEPVASAADGDPPAEHRQREGQARVPVPAPRACAGSSTCSCRGRGPSPCRSTAGRSSTRAGCCSWTPARPRSVRNVPFARFEITARAGASRRAGEAGIEPAGDLRGRTHPPPRRPRRRARPRPGPRVDQRDRAGLPRRSPFRA